MSKVILITGISSGFGHLTALAMLAERYTVYATMRNVDSEAARELTADGATVLFLDVTDPVSIETAVNSVTAKEQIIDVLINNADVAAAGMSEFSY